MSHGIVHLSWVTCLQVDVLELKPRPNPGQGNRTFGSNTAGSWGER